MEVCARKTWALINFEGFLTVSFETALEGKRLLK